MSTLTFECPFCQRQYRRVKMEMRGYRVQCTCGREFRLGDKTERLPGVDREMNQRRRQRLLDRGELDAIPADPVWDEIEFVQESDVVDPKTGHDPKTGQNPQLPQGPADRPPG